MLDLNGTGKAGRIRIVVAGVAVWLVGCTGVADSNIASEKSSGATLSYIVQGQPAYWPADRSIASHSTADANYSPDGTRWLDGSFYALTLHDIVSGEEIVIARGATGQEIIPESVSWSPDGRRFAYFQFGLNSYQVQIVTLDGLTQRSVGLPVNRAGSRIAWLSGQRLVYSDLDRLLVYSLEDGSVRDLGEGRMPRPSPDGTLLAFERVSSVARDGCATAVGVGLAQADGSQWRMVLEEAGRFASVVGWSEGGEALLALSRPIDCNADQTPQVDRLLRIDVSSGAVGVLASQVDGPWPLTLLASDPFSKRVAFVRPGCDPSDEAEVAQELVLSATDGLQQAEVIAGARVAGCAFSLLHWLSPAIERPAANYSVAP